MRNYYRWAALAGAVVLASSNVLTAWADENSQNGKTFETAVEVPVSDGGQGNGGGAGQMPGEVIPSGTEGGQAPSGNAGNNQAPAAGGGNAQAPAGADAGTGAGSGQTAGTGAGSGQQAAAGTGAGNGQAAADGQQAGTGGTSSTRVIRTGGDSSSGGASAGETASSGASSSAGGGNVDYSRGPGYVPQEQDQTQAPAQQPQLDPNSQSGTDANVQVYDVANPVVKTAEKYSYDQMVQDITVLQQNNSSRMQVNTIGTSLDGRAIYDCIIGNPAAPKHILIQAGIHGREYLNPMLLMQQMEMILANYDTGSFHGHPLSLMFEQVAVHFVPMTNPDGVTISQFGLDQIRSQQLKDTISTCYVMDMAAGRTTADPASYLSRWKANARGVDLNLNFDALWQDVYSVEFQSYSGYKGTAPGSEPESQALINLYNSQYPWKTVINYHSMGDVIYWDIAGNKVQQESLELANLMSAVTGGYRVLPSNGGGGYKDWIQLSGNPVPGVTLETGKVACPIPISEYATIWNQNRLTWAYAMEWAAMH